MGGAEQTPGKGLVLSPPSPIPTLMGSIMHQIGPDGRERDGLGGTKTFLKLTSTRHSTSQLPFHLHIAETKGKLAGGVASGGMF